MDTMTITEGLAELKTIGKRLVKKREGILPYIWRQEGIKDAIREEGGSAAFIAREVQAIADLEKRIVLIREAIQTAGRSTPITVEGVTMNLTSWLTWRKEVAPDRRTFLHTLLKTAQTARATAKQKGWGAVSVAKEKDAESATDVVIHIDEQALIAEVEQLEKILGDLDGQLQLRNATVQITV